MCESNIKFDLKSQNQLRVELSCDICPSECQVNVEWEDLCFFHRFREAISNLKCGVKILKYLLGFLLFRLRLVPSPTFGIVKIFVEFEIYSER